MGKKYKWEKLADSEADISWSREGIGEASFDGKKICIARLGEKFHAFSHQCPHAGAPLTEGWLDAKGNVVCPVHGYKFNLQTGRGASGEGYDLKCWPVEKREDGIYIGIEERGFLSWLK